MAFLTILKGKKDHHNDFIKNKNKKTKDHYNYLETIIAGISQRILKL